MIEIPPSVKEILDHAAGKEHSENGVVMTTLRECIAEYLRVHSVEV